MDGNERKGLWLGGMPWWLTLCAIALCLIPVYVTTGSGDDASMVQATSMAGSLAICIGLAVIFNEIGERIPIWNKYIGGGLLLAFFGVAILKQFGLIPEQGLDAINSFVSDDANFLEFFIIMLIVGSVLSLDRDILLRSFGGYVPAILGGLAAASVLGVITGFLFGVAPSDAIIKYVLPIMGGGNGAGAVPLSQIYEQVTGDAAANYYSFAIIVLTIANIFCIIASAALNALGEKQPWMTGDKKTLLRQGGNIARDDTIDVRSGASNEGLHQSKYSKTMISDIPSWFRDGRLSDFEIQKAAQNFIFTRVELYASSMLLLQYSVSKGQKKSSLTFSSLNEVLLVVLMVDSPKAFKEYGKTCDKYIHRFTTMTSDTGLSYPSKAKMIYVQLDKCLAQFKEGRNAEAKDGKPDELQLWLAMIADVNDEQVSLAAENSKELQDIRKEAFLMGQDKDVLLMVLNEEFARMDWATDMAMSEERGWNKGWNKGGSDFAALIRKLRSLGRGDDAERAIEDDDYRTALYKEFNLA